jgi:hypothetical protein
VFDYETSPIQPAVEAVVVAVLINRGEKFVGQLRSAEFDIYVIATTFDVADYCASALLCERWRAIGSRHTKTER